MASPSSITVPEALQGSEPLLTRQFQVIHGENPKEFTRKLIAKFGKRYIDLVKQYGAVEYVTDDSGEIVDIVAAEEYLAESDEFAIERFRIGAHDSRRYSITAGALARLADAEAQFYAIQYDQLRCNPSFLREQIEEAALHRPELFPDAHGRAPKVATLLANPRFVGQLCRFTIHNLLGHLGIWNILGKYLADIQELDERKGRFGAPKRRGELMGYVKFMVEGEMEVVEKRVRHGLLVHTLDKGIWLREKNHPDFTGAVLGQHPDKLEDFITAFSADTLDGSFVRFVAPDLASSILKWTTRQRRGDLFQRLAKEPARWQTFDPFLAEQLTQLKRLIDFSEMLGYPDEGTIPPDARYNGFALSLRQSEVTFRSIDLERHIKDIASLENQSSFARLWEDVDAAFERKHQGTPESSIGFVQPAPKWYIPEEAPRVAAPPPKPAKPKPLAAPGPPPPPTKVRPPSPAPADVKPYWDKSAVLNPIPPAGEVFPKKGSKGKKSRRAQAPIPYIDREPETIPAPLDDKEGLTLSCGIIGLQIDNAEAQPKQKLPVFFVSKKAYDVFEMILGGHKGQLNFDDLKSALKQIGFRYANGDGSRAVFYPPASHINTPYFVHLPHGSRSTLDHTRLKICAKYWKTTYGWTIDWFALKSAAPA
ncbi:hypothetical protein CCMSSC00406_0008954 [Pleurotus cornucopiae]|uniref:Uncharacterized protein n=1 Tax=Pleurotus cornucopiae TaxID=5321 RepID=A0ACB7IZX8_PLECO|nr:hypothetical protein CCMSSC00406_0008954 [Pleurotus cornucopiae]